MFFRIRQLFSHFAKLSGGFDDFFPMQTMAVESSVDNYGCSRYHHIYIAAHLFYKSKVFIVKRTMSSQSVTPYSYR